MKQLILTIVFIWVTTLQGFALASEVIDVGDFPPHEFNHLIPDDADEEQEDRSDQPRHATCSIDCKLFFSNHQLTFPKTGAYYALSGSSSVFNAKDNLLLRPPIL